MICLLRGLLEDLLGLTPERVRPVKTNSGLLLRPRLGGLFDDTTLQEDLALIHLPVDLLAVGEDSERGVREAEPLGRLGRDV